MKYPEGRETTETRFGVQSAMGRGIVDRFIRFINWGSSGEEDDWEIRQNKCGVCMWGVERNRM